MPFRHDVALLVYYMLGRAIIDNQYHQYNNSLEISIKEPIFEWSDILIIDIFFLGTCF
jgi:hypothetical protein